MSNHTETLIKIEKLKVSLPAHLWLVLNFDELFREVLLDKLRESTKQVIKSSLPHKGEELVALYEAINDKERTARLGVQEEVKRGEDSPQREDAQSNQNKPSPPAKPTTTTRKR